MIRLTVSAKSLSSALGSVVRTIERRNTIPILGNVFLGLEGKSLTLRGTDLDIEVTTRLDVVSGHSASLTLPASMLDDITRKLGKAEVDLSWDEARPGRVIVQSGRSRFTLNSLPAEDFPDFSSGEMSHSLSLTSTALEQLLAPVSHAVSTEETRYYLNGIHLHGTAEGLLVSVATDGHRLALRELPLQGIEGMPPIIIPRKTCERLLQLCRDASKGANPEDESPPGTLALSAQKMSFTLGQTRLVSKLVDGQFPEYQRVIPRNNPHTARVDTQALADAVERVALVSQEKSRAVAFHFGGGKLVLTVNNPDAGSAEEEVDVVYEGPDLSIGFNSTYVKDMCAAMAAGGNCEVTFELNDGVSPTRITAKNNASAPTAVLMPMRV
jgi:DNA polymerase-3 subunit beta